MAGRFSPMSKLTHARKSAHPCGGHGPCRGLARHALGSKISEDHGGSGARADRAIYDIDTGRLFQGSNGDAAGGAAHSPRWRRTADFEVI
jgi:hypothetical protein